jgi:hypothetical protein
VTLLAFLQAIVHTFAQLGARHVYSTKQGSDGIVATHHYLAVVCRIPAHHAAHAILHCSGWIRLP